MLAIVTSNCLSNNALSALGNGILPIKALLFLEPEILEWNRKQVQKRIEIVEYPPLLLICFKRFTNQNQKYPWNSMVDVIQNQKICMEKYLSH